MAKVRDLVSGLTHCIGAALSLVGLVILIVFSAIWGDAYNVVSFTIFGVGLFLLYLFSTLYHWLNISEKGLNVFRKLDHIMIYILIASSYTPVCSAIWIKAPRIFSTGIYLMMGWVILFALYPLIKVFQEANLLYSLLWLVLGGIFYTIGGIIYATKWPKKAFKNFGFHEIFHIFVMLGSACQYWFILRYVLMF